MDTSAPISFNNDGVCNYCTEIWPRQRKKIFMGIRGKKFLHKKIQEIKIQGKRKKYDAIAGLSGGADSCRAIIEAYNRGLRLLLVTFDNGYDDPIAVENVQKIVEYTDYDHLIVKPDFREFYDLQLAFLRASVVDIEVITDNAVNAVLYGQASKHNVKFILSGSNIATEGIMGAQWTYRKVDLKNIMRIHRKFGNLQKIIKKVPLIGIRKYTWYSRIKRIERFAILNYLDYNREESIQYLKKLIGWKDYGIKHGESIFTRFYQCYILPEKFGIDKRRAHFSTLINSDQMTRKDAMQELRRNPYHNRLLLEKHKKIVLNKLRISEMEFNYLISHPRVEHKEYGTDRFWVIFFNFIFSPIQTFKKGIRKIFGSSITTEEK